MAIHEQIIGVSILLLAGYVGGKIARLFKLPAVAGYIITGIVLGPLATNIIPMSLNESLGGIKVLGLALIALIIGGELHFGKLKRLGKSITVITLAQVGGAFRSSISNHKVYSWHVPSYILTIGSYGFGYSSRISSGCN
ncbi:MAG: cation:proton antiporter [Actinomycetota bacterium]